jgi:hypothetical protein
VDSVPLGGVLHRAMSSAVTKVPAVKLPTSERIAESERLLLTQAVTPTAPRSSATGRVRGGRFRVGRRTTAQ